MKDAFAQLGRAICVNTTMISLTLGAHNMSAAYRTTLGHLERPLPARVILVLHHADHLRNDVAAALHLHPVPNLHSQPLDLIHVVQRGPTDSCAPNRDRLEPCHRRQLSCTSHLGDNVFDLGYGASCCVLVGDRPAWSLPRVPQFFLQACAVNLNDDAIDLIGQALALTFPLLNKRPHAIDILYHLACGVHLETDLLEYIQSLRVAVEVRTPLDQQHVAEIIQAAAGSDAWFKL